MSVPAIYLCSGLLLISQPKALFVFPRLVFAPLKVSGLIQTLFLFFEKEDPSR